MEYNNLGKKDIAKILANVQKIVEIITPNNELAFENQNVSHRSTHNSLDNIIGILPSLLLNEKIFESNIQIIDFAQSLNISIPDAQFKQKEDLIGWIVSAISKFDKTNIEKINTLLKTMNKSVSKKEKTNFFKDWGSVIKEINL